MRILIVEDDSVARTLLQKILTKYGDCDVVENGVKALEAFEIAIEDGLLYDLICLDIMMPEMDGQSVLKEIRRREEDEGVERGHGVKIIMTTSLQDSRNMIKAYEENCDAYIDKPVAKEALLDLLKSLGLVDYDAA